MVRVGEEGSDSVGSSGARLDGEAGEDEPLELGEAMFRVWWR